MLKRVQCQKCERFMFEAFVFVGKYPCPNKDCKHLNELKVVTTDLSKMLRFKFDADAGVRSQAQRG